jgi:hypothetical protein
VEHAWKHEVDRSGGAKGGWEEEEGGKGDEGVMVQVMRQGRGGHQMPWIQGTRP